MTTAARMAAMAATQVGYRSGSSTNSKYNTWYGMPNAYWCQIFVSWCAHQTGTPNMVIPKAASTREVRKWFIARGRWHAGTSGIRRGDLAYFYYKGRVGPVNHVAIVESVSAGKVTTIDGNWNGGGVYRRVATGIVGFGRPAYATATTPTTPDNTIREEDMGFYFYNVSNTAGRYYFFNQTRGKSRPISKTEWDMLRALEHGATPKLPLDLHGVSAQWYAKIIALGMY